MLGYPFQLLHNRLSYIDKTSKYERKNLEKVNCHCLFMSFAPIKVSLAMIVTNRKRVSNWFAGGCSQARNRIMDCNNTKWNSDNRCNLFSFRSLNPSLKIPLAVQFISHPEDECGSRWDLYEPCSRAVVHSLHNNAKIAQTFHSPTDESLLCSLIQRRFAQKYINSAENFSSFTLIQCSCGMLLQGWFDPRLWQRPEVNFQFNFAQVFATIFHWEWVCSHVAGAHMWSNKFENNSSFQPQKPQKILRSF